MKSRKSEILRGSRPRGSESVAQLGDFREDRDNPYAVHKDPHGQEAISYFSLL